jgi:hypothetical protein
MAGRQQVADHRRPDEPRRTGDEHAHEPGTSWPG